MKPSVINLPKKALTFDDALLIPAKSNVLPSQVSLETRLTKKIRLNIPIMSAAMDTVPSLRLPLLLLERGGGRHNTKNMSIEKQADEVERVKRSENGVITNPFFPLQRIITSMKHRTHGEIQKFLAFRYVMSRISLSA